MIYWAPFLHFYQPSFQFHSVLKKICDTSYRPLLNVLGKTPEAKITVNINGVLTELLSEHGAQDVIDGLADLARSQRLEFADSAKFHPILPLIPKKEMRRQIRLNRWANEHLFKDAYKVGGFFPPEMCYSPAVAQVVKSMGLKWVLLSGIAHADAWPQDFITSLGRGASGLKIFFRDDILSNKISFRSLDAASFLKELTQVTAGKKDAYCITAMDAETFGHHQPGWEKEFLAKVYESIAQTQKAKIKAVTISELLKVFPARSTKPPKASSWSTTKEDMLAGRFYPLWQDKDNPIHQLQWEHLDMCCVMVREAKRLKGNSSASRRFAVIARVLLDKAMHSCQFWWANKARDHWSENLIHKGLILQEEVLLNAYKAFSLSAMAAEQKKDFHYKFIAAQDIAQKIREALIS